MLVDFSEEYFFARIHLHFKLLVQLSFKFFARVRELLSTVVTNLLFTFLKLLNFYIWILRTLEVVVKDLGLLESHHFAKSIHSSLTSDRYYSKEVVKFCGTYY